MRSPPIGSSAESRWPSVGSRNSLRWVLRVPEIGKNVRSWIVGAYIIFYTQTEGTLLVLRIVHGARDLPVLFDP